MIYFLDFEASSLGQGSFPIEIGWMGEDGIGESHLIRPEPGWTEWSWESEQVHGISRDMLAEHGKPAEEVARRVLEALRPERDVCISDAPDHDQYWLGMLLRVTGGTSHPALLDISNLHRIEIQPLVARLRASGMASDDVRHAVLELVLSVHDDEGARARTRHRALPDAEGLRGQWLEVRRRAADLAGDAEFDEIMRQIRRGT